MCEWDTLHAYKEMYRLKLILKPVFLLSTSSYVHMCRDEACPYRGERSTGDVSLCGVTLITSIHKSFLKHLYRSFSKPHMKRTVYTTLSHTRIHTLFRTAGACQAGSSMQQHMTVCAISYRRMRLFTSLIPSPPVTITSVCP